LIIEHRGEEIPYTLWEEYKYLGAEVIDDKQLQSRRARNNA